MIRKGLRPRFRVGMAIHAGRNAYPGLWRFRRSWKIIAVLAVIDIIFMIPAVATFIQASGEWSRYDSLFDLVGAVFLSAWLLGWSMAPLIMTGILVLMLLGRETLTLRPGTIEVTFGLPFFGLVAIYEVAKMRNLRLEDPPKKSGSSWRGKHIVFDYGANPFRFGSDVSEEQLAEVRNGISTISGTAVRSGDPLPAETEELWEAESEIIPAAGGEEAVVDAAPVALNSGSTLLLVIANLVPVAGTLFLGWSLSDVLVLYWAESAVIGLFNICKIIMISKFMALFAVPFFIGHFGAFMAVHFLFIYTIFVKGIQGMNDSANDLADVARLFIGLWPALAALFVSHAYSFYTNFIRRPEYRRRTVGNQMSEPYSRIIFMQLVLILGGGLSMILGQTGPVLIGVIALKIYFDVKAHIKEHAPDDL
ncbi:DUF6498-containing protein [Pseudomonadota bacterium]